MVPGGSNVIHIIAGAITDVNDKFGCPGAVRSGCPGTLGSGYSAALGSGYSAVLESDCPAALESGCPKASGQLICTTSSMTRCRSRASSVSAAR